jgi:hypothetical protein
VGPYWTSGIDLRVGLPGRIFTNYRLYYCLMEPPGEAIGCEAGISALFENLKDFPLKSRFYPLNTS